MRFKQLLREKNEAIGDKKLPCIAFLGDSVTQGCFEVYQTGETTIETVFDSASAYHNKLRQMLAAVYPRIPVSIINAGLSGECAQQGLNRLERDVLCRQPDLVVVCFGLNDCFNGLEGIKAYTASLSGIFQKIHAAGGEVIFMTPNMVNTYVSCHIKADFIKKLAEDMAEIQNGGVFDAYIKAAMKVCEQEGVPVCDCYNKWKLMSQSGIDTTELLANYLNHPTREMHWLFANSLFDMILFDR